MDALPANRTWQPPCSHGTYQHEAITSRSRQFLMMGTWLPETCWATIRREMKNCEKWHLVGFSYPHWITTHGQPHISIPYCYEIALAALPYSDNRRSIFRAFPSIYTVRYIILPLCRDCNLSFPTTRPLSLSFNKAAASLLLFIITMLFISFSSVKCLEKSLSALRTSVAA